MVEFASSSDLAPLCIALVKAHAKPKAWHVRGRAICGGVYRQVACDSHWANYRQVAKVKAHSVVKDGDSPLEVQHALANQKVDELAKKAAKRHGSDHEVQNWYASQVDDLVQQAGAVYKVAAAVLPLWVSQQYPRLPARERSNTQVCAQRKVLHLWAKIGGRWQCTACLTYCRAASVGPTRWYRKCSGTNQRLKAVVDKSGSGHNLAIGTTVGNRDGLHFVICVRCGAYASTHARGLRESCLGRPGTGAGKCALRRVGCGQHTALVALQDAADTLRCAACDELAKHCHLYAPFFAHCDNEHPAAASSYAEWVASMRESTAADQLVVHALANVCNIHVQVISGTAARIDVARPAAPRSASDSLPPLPARHRPARHRRRRR